MPVLPGWTAQSVPEPGGHRRDAKWRLCRVRRGASRSRPMSLPPDMDPVHGAFSEPLACCLHALDVARIRPGDAVAVLGGGVIGLLMVQLARLAGAGEIILVTRQQARRDLALKLGATLAVDPTVLTGRRGARRPACTGVDVVLECAGVPDTLQQGLRMLRAGRHIRALRRHAGGSRGADHAVRPSGQRDQARGRLPQSAHPRPRGSHGRQRQAGPR